MTKADVRKPGRPGGSERTRKVPLGLSPTAPITNQSSRNTSTKISDGGSVGTTLSKMPRPKRVAKVTKARRKVRTQGLGSELGKIWTGGKTGAGLGTRLAAGLTGGHHFVKGHDVDHFDDLMHGFGASDKELERASRAGHFGSSMGGIGTNISDWDANKFGKGKEKRKFRGPEGSKHKGPLLDSKGQWISRRRVRSEKRKLDFTGPGEDKPSLSNNIGTKRVPQKRGRGQAAISYQSVPGSFNTQVKNSKPNVGGFSADYCRIRHAEPLPNMTTTGSLFNLKTLPINPGIASVFPWLSGLATRYENYRFRRLRVHYITRANTFTSGEVAMCFDYNVTDEPPPTMIHCLEMEDSDDFVVYAPYALLAATNANLAKRKSYKIRFGGLPTSGPNVTTKDLYDTCLLHLCNEGYNGGPNDSLGRIWIEYDVELMTEQIHSHVGDIALGGIITGGANATLANPLGDLASAVIHPGSHGIGLVDVSGVTSLEVYKNANYQVSFLGNTSGTTNLVSMVSDGSIFNVIEPCLSITPGSAAMAERWLPEPAAGDTSTYSIALTGGTVGNAFLYVSTMPYSVVALEDEKVVPTILYDKHHNKYIDGVLDLDDEKTELYDFSPPVHIDSPRKTLSDSTIMANTLRSALGKLTI